MNSIIIIHIHWENLPWIGDAREPTSTVWTIQRWGAQAGPTFLGLFLLKYWIRPVCDYKSAGKVKLNDGVLKQFKLSLVLSNYCVLGKSSRRLSFPWRTTIMGKWNWNCHITMKIYTLAMKLSICWVPHLICCRHPLFWGANLRQHLVPIRLK